jgi:hypothetical protein
VPRPSAQAGGGARPPRPHFDFSGAFVFVSAALFFAALAGSVGVFLYARYLAGEEVAKDQELAAAQAQIDQGTIASLVALQQQLVEGKQLLDQHVAFSQFLEEIGTLTPTTVSFQSLSMLLAADHSATVAISGTAASFNALAALSASLATNLAIKDAIFSGISVGKGGVGFTLSANIDPSLIVMPATGFAPAGASAATP